MKYINQTKLLTAFLMLAGTAITVTTINPVCALASETESASGASSSSNASLDDTDASPSGSTNPEDASSASTADNTGSEDASSARSTDSTDSETASSASTADSTGSEAANSASTVDSTGSETTSSADSTGSDATAQSTDVVSFTAEDITPTPIGWYQSGDSWYYYSAQGELQTGWQQIGSAWFYLDPVTGIMQTGWLTLGANRFYLHPYGAMATGWLHLGQTWYYLKSSGAAATGWQQIGKYWYYFSPEDAAMHTGWLSLGNNLFYMSNSGAMVTGSRKIDGKTYLFSADGASQGSGDSIRIFIPQTTGDQTRYGDSTVIYNTVTKDCIVIDGGLESVQSSTIAHLRENGLTAITLVVTHWHDDHADGALAILQAAGISVDRCILWNPEELQNVGENGYEEDILRGHEFIGAARKAGATIQYISAGKVTDISVGTIQCKAYRKQLDLSKKEGFRHNDMSIACYFPELSYFTSADTITSTNIAANALTGQPEDQITVFKIPHHGNAAPETVVNNMISKGAKLCWYNDTGDIDSYFNYYGAYKCDRALTTINTVRSILITTSNKLMTVTTGSRNWKFSVPYASAPIADGWFQSSGKWYWYNNNHYSTGWTRITWKNSPRWFFFKKNGQMRTGWMQDGSAWYYLNPTDGAMLTGWAKIGNHWYYLGTDGKMRTGWLRTGGYWYYLDPQNGAMLTGRHYLEWYGEKSWYTFNKQGKLI